MIQPPFSKVPPPPTLPAGAVVGHLGSRAAALPGSTPLAALSVACERAKTWHSPLCGMESDTYADRSPPCLLAEVRNGMDSEDKARVQALVGCVWQSVSPGSDCAWSSDADQMSRDRGSCRWTCSQSAAAADRGGRARQVANERGRKLHGWAALCAHFCVASCAPLCRHHFLCPFLTQRYICLQCIVV